MKRRKILIQVAGYVAGGAVIGLTGSCGTGIATGAGNDDLDEEPEFLEETTTTFGGHSHLIRIPFADMESPSDSKTYTSSSSSGHTHQLTLSAVELSQIASGGLVASKPTTIDGAAPHQHFVSLQIES